MKHALKTIYMSLLRDYNDLGAQRLTDFTSGVILGLSDAIFSSLAAAVAVLTTLNNALADSILPFTERTTHTDNIMMEKKALVVKKLDEMRPLVEAICLEDETKERLSGFTPSKRGRTVRTSIDAAVLTGVKPTGTAGQLLISLAATIPGNTGYEVHCVNGEGDVIKGIFKVKGRTKQILATGFPSLTPVEVYLITLSTNNVRSLPSNSLPGAAS